MIKKNRIICKLYFSNKQYILELSGHTNINICSTITLSFWLVWDLIYNLTEKNRNAKIQLTPTSKKISFDITKRISEQYFVLNIIYSFVRVLISFKKQQKQDIKFILKIINNDLFKNDKINKQIQHIQKLLHE